MAGNCAYDRQMLDRYFDGELTRDDAEQVARHLQACTACRGHVDRNQLLADGLRYAVDRQPLPEKLAWIGQAGYRSPPRPPLWRQIRQWLDLRWAIPAGALAAAGVMGLMMWLPGSPQAPVAPSAIVTSFSGEISSVTILETPHQRQTIIWINENGDTHEDAV